MGKDADDVEIVNAKLDGGHFYSGPINMNGQGAYKWNDGTFYCGDFIDGEMTGFGYYKYKNGIYSGHVYNGIRHGYGVLILFEAKIKYVGQWCKGVRHGQGILYYNCDFTKLTQYIEQNEITITNIKDNEQIQFFLSQSYKTSAYYDGEWVNGSRSGNGKCSYVNGDEYNGDWRNDKKHGKGMNIHFYCFNLYFMYKYCI